MCLQIVWIMEATEVPAVVPCHDHQAEMVLHTVTPHSDGLVVLCSISLSSAVVQHSPRTYQAEKF